MKNLSLQQLFSDEVYQVSEVKLSAKLINELFGQDREELAAAIGYFYTGAYQKATHRLVLPPLAGRAAIHDDIVDNLYALSLDSQSGSISMTMPKARHTIRLNLTGAASGELEPPKGARGTRYMGYQVWMSKTPLEGAENPKETIKDFRILPGGGSQAVIERDDRDVFAGLALQLAMEMGGQKR